MISLLDGGEEKDASAPRSKKMKKKRRQSGKTQPTHHSKCKGKGEGDVAEVKGRCEVHTHKDLSKHTPMHSTQIQSVTIVVTKE